MTFQKKWTWSKNSVGDPWDPIFFLLTWFFQDTRPRGKWKYQRKLIVEGGVCMRTPISPWPNCYTPGITPKHQKCLEGSVFTHFGYFGRYFECLGSHFYNIWWPSWKILENNKVDSLVSLWVLKICSQNVHPKLSKSTAVFNDFNRQIWFI
jgi:hypothetical protein